MDFWIENDRPPPLELFLEFIRFGSRTLPKGNATFIYLKTRKHKETKREGLQRKGKIIC